MTTAKLEATEEAIEILLQSLDEQTHSKILLKNRLNLVGMFTGGGDIEPEISAAHAFLSDIMNPGYCGGNGVLCEILSDALALATDFKMSIYVWEVFLQWAIVEEDIYLYGPSEQENFLEAFPELFEGNDIIRDYAEKIGLETA
jgi:hypothetical protein